MKKVVADQTRCIGAGNCVVSAPKLFTQGKEDGLVQVILSIVSDSELENALSAIKSCPGQALDIVDRGE